MTDPRHFGGRRGIVLFEPRQFQHDTTQPFFAVVEGLLGPSSRSMLRAGNKAVNSPNAWA